MARVFLIVMDGVGAGAMPDAAAFGDTGADTLGHVDTAVGGLELPNFAALGLGNLKPLRRVTAVAAPKAHFGTMAERNPGKDSTAGHWEICGIAMERAFRVFPNGFPATLLQPFCQRAGINGYLGNKAASGTGIVDELGAEHLRTGLPIIYTSADSVFQIAAHIDIIPLPKLYRLCEIAFELTAPLDVGRVIARPFRGVAGKFERVGEARKDYSVSPPNGTLLDLLQAARVPVHGVGKVDNLFAGRGFTDCIHTRDNRHGVDEILRLAEKTKNQSALIFANLVDFDTMYGHRNDPKGFAEALRALDRRLPELQHALREDDLLAFTADHGNDPTHPGSDHTREHVPLLVTDKNLLAGKTAAMNLGLRRSYADLGATVADFLKVGPLTNGKSFLKEIARA